MSLLRDDTAHRSSLLGVTALLVGLLASACVGGGPGAPADAGATPSDASDGSRSVAADVVAVRVEYVGGFLPGVELAARSPLVSVYADGRVVANGPVPTVHPGPALPNVQQWRIAPAEVTAFAERVVAAGVGSGVDFGRPSVTDMPDTRFTVTTDDGVRQAAVYALAVDDRAAGSLTDAQRAARTKLLDVLTELSAPSGEPTEYTVSSLAVVSLPYRAPDPSEPSAWPPVAWPGPALPGDPIGPDGALGCVTVTGDAAATVLAAAAKANAVTQWTSGGRSWFLRFRPLLPDESGCADLAGR